MSATTKKDTPKKKGDNDKDEPIFLNYCSFSQEEMIAMAQGSAELRASYTVPVSTVTKEDVLAEAPMGFLEHLACLLFLSFGIPCGAFTIPALLFLIGKFLAPSHKIVWTIFLAIAIPLALIPQPFYPSLLQSWMATQIHRYFSFRFILEQHPAGKDHAPQILVAPPHGVFPYGNILAILIYPSLVGFHMRAIASSAALRAPIFRQIMCSIGIVDASRDTARHALTTDNKCIGISTGGVAEVFETNAEHECIVLRERKGMIKLAIRTGAELVPCYLFGNTKIMSCWAGGGIPGGRPFLEKLSRKIGFALILIFGRFGLPIPRRIPILAVMGKRIPTAHIQCEEPTMEQVDKIQELLLDEMQGIFDRYKGLYGWDDKDLIIK